MTSLVEIEQQLIGGLYAEPDRAEEVFAILHLDDLLSTPAREAFSGLQRLRRRGMTTWAPEDLTAFCRVDQRWLAQAVSRMPTSVVHFAREIRHKALARQVKARCSKALETFPEEEDVSSSISRLTSDLEDLRKRASQLEPADMEATTDAILRKSAAAKAGRGGPVLLGDAFRDVTDTIRGLMRGRLYILAGLSGTGKTAVGLHWAFFGGRRPLFVTSEMTEEDLLTRLMSHLSGVPQPNIECGDVTEGQWHALERARRQIIGSGLTVLGAHGQTADEVAAAIADLHRHRQFDIIVHDYLQLLQRPWKGASEYEAVSHSSRVMMRLAKRLDPKVAMIQIAQLNRESERREDPEPRKSDLRGSGAIEQDADGIFLLHRPSAYPNAKSPLKDDPSALLVVLAKNRSGPTGRWCVRTDFATYRFERYVDYPVAV